MEWQFGQWMNTYVAEDAKKPNECSEIIWKNVTNEDNV